MVRLAALASGLAALRSRDINPRMAQHPIEHAVGF